MFNVIQPVPRWMAQSPRYIVDTSFSSGSSTATPTGTQDGDLMIAVGYDDGGTLSTPSGWTAVTSGSSSYGGITQLLAIWKRTASSEGATQTLDGAVCGVITLRNATDVDNYSGFNWCGIDEKTRSDITIPSFTVSNAGYLFSFVGIDSHSYDVTDEPSSMSLLDEASTSGASVRIKAYYKTQMPGSSGSQYYRVSDATPEPAGTDPGMGGVMVQVY